MFDFTFELWCEDDSLFHSYCTFRMNDDELKARRKAMDICKRVYDDAHVWHIRLIEKSEV